MWYCQYYNHRHFFSFLFSFFFCNFLIHFDLNQFRKPSATFKWISSRFVLLTNFIVWPDRQQIWFLHFAFISFFRSKKHSTYHFKLGFTLTNLETGQHVKERQETKQSNWRMKSDFAAWLLVDRILFAFRPKARFNSFLIVPHSGCFEMTPNGALFNINQTQIDEWAASQPFVVSRHVALPPFYPEVCPTHRFLCFRSLLCFFFLNFFSVRFAFHLDLVAKRYSHLLQMMATFSLCKTFEPAAAGRRQSIGAFFHPQVDCLFEQTVNVHVLGSNKKWYLTFIILSAQIMFRPNWCFVLNGTLSLPAKTSSFFCA